MDAQTWSFSALLVADQIMLQYSADDLLIRLSILSKKTNIKVTRNEVESEDDDLDAHVCVTRASDAPIEVS